MGLKREGIMLRRRMKMSLIYKEQTINQLATRFSLGRSTVVYHLAVLEDSGAVSAVPESWPIRYRRKK